MMPELGRLRVTNRIGATMAIRLPRAAEREFIAASNICAVYVAALPSGPSFVSISRDLLHSLIALRRRWSGVRIISAHWVEGKTEARLICREVNASLPRGPSGLLVATAKDAERRVQNVAARMNITLTHHADLLIRAKAAVDFIENHIAHAEAKGELRWFNQAYRAWRLAAKEEGRSMTYAEARARLRRHMFREVLLTSEFVRVLNSIFPPLRTLNLD
jgi:hypothetical protein